MRNTFVSYLEPVLCLTLCPGEMVVKDNMPCPTHIPDLNLVELM
jgi:hypothetical protein